MLDLIIKSDRVVTPQGVREYDIGIRGEQIVSVAVPGVITEGARRVVDARGKIVVPGGIEPHAHANMPLAHDPGLRSQGTDATSRAAAFGGTTTIVDFAGFPPVGDLLTNVAEKHKDWAGNSYTDYTFHCTIVGEPSFEHLEQIPEVVKQGLSSIKIFTMGGNQVEEGYIYEIMDRVARVGGIMAVHAENQSLIKVNYRKLKRQGRIGFENIHLGRSNLSEDVEFRKILRLAEQAGVGVYFVHVTAKEGVAAITEARSRGLPVYGEVLHNYLAFTSEDYREPDGVKYHTYPSLKFPEDRDAMWAAVLDGRLATVATDDSTTPYEIKVKGKTIYDARGGHNGVETRVPYVFSEGVSKGRMPLERFVELTSSNAAKILGMYPKKGAIAPGSDADIVVIDPNIRKKLELSDLHGDADYSVWEGWDFQGWPTITVLRGKMIVEEGKFIGSLSDGKFVACKIAPEVLKGPAC